MSLRSLYHSVQFYRMRLACRLGYHVGDIEVRNGIVWLDCSRCDKSIPQGPTRAEYRLRGWDE